MPYSVLHSRQKFSISQIIIILLGLLALPNSSTAQIYHYDVNGSGSVDVTDVMLIVNNILHIPNPGDNAPFSGTPVVDFTSQDISEKQNGWKIAWYILSDYWHTTNNNNAARSLNIVNYRGMKLYILANKEYDVHFAFTKNPSSEYSGSNDPEENSERSGEVHYATGSAYTMVEKGKSITLTIPDDANYLYVDYLRNSKTVGPERVTIFEEAIEGGNKYNAKTIHVDAKNGSDSNSGLSKASAVKTFSHALEISGQDVQIMLHGDTDEAFLPPSDKHSVSLIGEAKRSNRIIRGKIISEATLADKLYVAELPVEYFSKNEALNYDDYEDTAERDAHYKPELWIYQHDLDDASTEIMFKDRHPCQRGKQFRCGSTKLVRKNNKADLLSETNPAYFYDFNEQRLWVNVQPTANHPIALPIFNDYGVKYGGQNFNMLNIEVLYAAVELKNSIDATCTDCAARYVFSDGGFQWDSARNITLVRCEAASVTNGSGAGDGFNAHPANPVDKNAIIETASLYNCWAHDCYDDGFSDHSRSETDIYGGLFEYCGKGGLTPSFGAQDTIHNAESRYNRGAGILYAGKMSEEIGRQGGTAVAYNCFCHDNGNPNFFVTGNNNIHPNILKLINCNSHNASLNPSRNQASYKYGYSATGGNRIILINCTDGRDDSSNYLGAAYNAEILDVQSVETSAEINSNNMIYNLE